MKRACFYGKMSSILPTFSNLLPDEKRRFILCPTSEIVNKFMRIMFNPRDLIDQGIDLNTICYSTYSPHLTFINSTYFDQFSDCDEGEASFSSFSSINSDDST